MSPAFPLQCLFCDQLNPSGARFCNECGSQLHLQPCDRCGAINKRSAKNCHSCGAGFIRPAASDPDDAPARLEEPLAEPAPNDGGSAFKHAHPSGQHVEETAPSEQNVTPFIRSRRLWRIAASVAVLAVLVVSGNHYSEKSAEFMKTQGVIQYAPPVATTSIAADAAQSAVSAPVEAAPIPVAAPLPVTAPPPAVAVTARPSSAKEMQTSARRDPPVFKECADAIAALGFCGPGTQNEEK